MKPNRRSKRVKKTRRNRRSKRMQRGGEGNFGKRLKAYKETYDDCKRTCDRIVPDPMKIYTESKPTPNGWYLSSRPQHDWAGGGWGGALRGVEMVISNKSINTIEIGEYSHLEYNRYLDILDELPDLTKIYTTGNIGSKKIWKLIYDTSDKVLKWQNQNNNTEVVLFDIDSPLKIGDKMASSNQPKQNSSPSTTTPPNDIKGVEKLVEQTMAFYKARRAVESPELMSLRDLVKKLEAKDVELRAALKDKEAKP
jgi:hypothetical protein